MCPENTFSLNKILNISKYMEWIDFSSKYNEVK